VLEHAGLDCVVRHQEGCWQEGAFAFAARRAHRTACSQITQLEVVRPLNMLLVMCDGKALASARPAEPHRPWRCAGMLTAYDAKSLVRSLSVVLDACSLVVPVRAEQV
jgi:hypothetical protein